ncbi:hypothetical protein NSK_001121 [Nannochloropsis salina CCMP1776]|uniref:Uncharacterized protein n=1 Tax=Nannochloropsis salina CCMP1776 TaxID=1027361 RepID=A0A4D9D849_9STRA|nr:hypothetical protein NSK_001121 [Nannochloropsis salina CCMP1776]|eukprot:TFJ87772.1 hypothetical protein NSK_001121 [Nannochloropsis salina CCMP1776]
MLRGISLPGLSDRGPLRWTAASLGGLRNIRQGSRGGDKDVQEFLEEAVTPRGAQGPRSGAGRGSGSYERFIKTYKETVLTEEDKRFKTWSNWKDQLEDFENDGQEDLSGGEEGYLGSMVDMESSGRGAKKGRGRGRSVRGRSVRRSRGGRDEEGEEDVGSYFDWTEGSLFIPDLLVREGDEGGTVSDRIRVEDDLQLRLNKLLWRRLKLRARDLDQHVPRAYRRGRAVQRAMAEARAREARAGTGVSGAKGVGLEVQSGTGEDGVGTVRETRETSGGPESRGQGGEGHQEGSPDPVAGGVAPALDPDIQVVKRLNRARTLEAIEDEIGRLMVEGKVDVEMEEEQIRARRLQARARRMRSGEYDHGEDDLEEAVGEEVPTLDADEEGFEAFREYAEQLIEAGGVIEYRSTRAGKYDREMALPAPLATGRALEQALRRDRTAVEKVSGSKHRFGGKEKGTAPMSASDFEASAACAWLALNKNVSMGDTTRMELSEALAATLQRLQEKPGRLERVRARVKTAAASAGGRADGEATGGGGRGREG